MGDEEIIESFNSEKDKTLRLQLQKIDTLEQCIVIVLIGYIDTYNSTFFQQKVMTLINAGYVQIIFDCSQLEYVSSTGIGSFTSFLKTVKAKDGDIVLLSLQPKVYEVFQLLGFADFFNARDSLPLAIEVFAKHEKDESSLNVFPKIFACPICGKKLQAPNQGKFRCAECKTILIIDQNAQVSLG